MEISNKTLLWIFGGIVSTLLGIIITLLVTMKTDIDNRFNSIENRMNNRFNNIETQLNNHIPTEIRRVDTKVDDLKNILLSNKTFYQNSPIKRQIKNNKQQKRLNQ